MLERKFAEFCKIQRIKKKISQEELANFAGVSVKSVSTIENEKKVRDGTLVKIANYFGHEIKIVRDIYITSSESAPVTITPPAPIPPTTQEQEESILEEPKEEIKEGEDSQ